MDQFSDIIIPSSILPQKLIFHHTDDSIIKFAQYRFQKRIPFTILGGPDALKTVHRVPIKEGLTLNKPHDWNIPFNYEEGSSKFNDLIILSPETLFMIRLGNYPSLFRNHIRALDPALVEVASRKDRIDYRIGNNKVAAYEEWVLDGLYYEVGIYNAKGSMQYLKDITFDRPGLSVGEGQLTIPEILYTVGL